MNLLGREDMIIQQISVQTTITWTRLSAPNGPYRWGDRKDSNVDSNWRKANVVYRWVKNSTGDIAIVGETDRTLSERVNNYISASPKSQAGQTNKKVYQEQQKLQKTGDFLYLEFTDVVPGYNLMSQRERRLAERLLIGITKPYLQ